MKRVFAVMLAVLLILSINACGKQSGDPTKTSETNAASSGSEETKESKEKPEPSVTESSETSNETLPAESSETAAETEPSESETQEHGSNTEQNSGFYSMYGTAARLGSYTYFISNGLNNDCSWNGSAYSASIYRIHDLAVSKPELVYTAPASVWAGTEQETLFYMADSAGKLWFMELQDFSTDDIVMRWLDPESLETGEVRLPFSLRYLSKSFDSDGIYFDNCCYYFISAKETETAYERTLWRFDPADSSFSEISLDGLAAENELAYIFTVSHGYAYYCVGNFDSGSWTNGIYRTNLDAPAPEEVCSIDVENQLEDAEYFYATEEYLYWFIDDELRAVRISDGKKLTVLTENEGLDPGEYYPTWYINEEEIWFAAPEGLFVCGPEGDNVKKIADDPAEEDKMGLFVSGSWLWYSLNDHPEYTRILNTGRIFPEKALVKDVYSDIVEEKSNAAWKYEVFPNFVRIVGAAEPEGALELPKEIDGLPVRSILCWYSDGFEGAYTLTLPEGLVSCGYVYAEGVERIELPMSIETFTHRGFTYSFRTDTETTFVYPGTLEEFEAVCRHSSELYADTGIDADCGSTSFILECKDGLFTCEPSPSGEEVFVPYEEAEEDVLIRWLGIWECENGEKIEIDVADADQGLQLLYHGFTAAGSPFETAYNFAFENDEMTVAGEDKSVEQLAGWRYQLILDEYDNVITLKSRYPDKFFTKED